MTMQLSTSTISALLQSRICLVGLALLAVGLLVTARSIAFIGHLPLSSDVSSLRLAPQYSASTCANVTIRAHAANDGVPRLYSRDGHEHNASSVLDARFLAVLTHEAQRFIWEQQHPEDCAGAVYLVSNRTEAVGIGSHVHVAGWHLAVALETGRVMVWGASSGAEWTDAATCGHVTNVECHFRAPSRCSLRDAARSRSAVYAGVQNHRFFFSPDVLGDTPTSLVPAPLVARLRRLQPDMSDDAIKYWWRGQSAAYLMRLNEHALAHIRALRRDSALFTVVAQHAAVGESLCSFPLPPGTLHTHIRRSDKYSEMQLVDTRTYVSALERAAWESPTSLRRLVFVTSEDERVLPEALAYLTAGADAFSVIYAHVSRSQGSPIDAASGQQARAHLQQLVMSLEADAHVLTRESNWCRLIDELRCVWVEKCQQLYKDVGKQTYEW